MEDFYGILGVQSDVDEDSIQRAYRRLALQLHPDRTAAASSAAVAAFQKLAEAYETLKDPIQRQKYDAARRGTLLLLPCLSLSLDSVRTTSVSCFEFCIEGANSID